MKTIVHFDVRSQGFRSFILPRYVVEDYSLVSGIQNGFLSTKKIQYVGFQFLNPDGLTL